MSGSAEGQVLDPVATDESPDLVEGDHTDDIPSEGGPDQYGRLEARMDNFQDSMSELRDAILANNRNQDSRTAQSPVVETFDDEEPLTPSKVNRIVQNAVIAGAAQSNTKSERTLWDNKARADFPLDDPKFVREFKKEWKSFTESGGDANHPKAVHTVARIASKGFGVTKTKNQRSQITNDGVEHNAEVPTNSRPGLSAGRKTALSAKSQQQLDFYNMKSNKTDAQIKSFSDKLLEKQVREERRNRA